MCNASIDLFGLTALPVQPILGAAATSNARTKLYIQCSTLHSTLTIPITPKHT